MVTFNTIYNWFLGKTKKDKTEQKNMQGQIFSNTASSMSAYNYTTSTWTGSSGTAQFPPDFHCRICGERISGGPHDDVFNHTCYKCDQAMREKEIRALIPADSKEHCLVCFSHINACTCPEKQKMDELTQ